MQDRAQRNEQGYAMFLTVMMIMVMAAMGVSILQHASNEHMTQRSSKRKTSTLAAAEAGMSLVMNRLFAIESVNQALVNQATGALMDPLQPIDEPGLIVDEWGFPTAVRTGTVGSAVALPIEMRGLKVPDGYSLNAGEQTAMYRIYRASVVATDSGGGNVQLQAQFKVREASSYQ